MKISITSFKHFMNKSLGTYEQAKQAYTYSGYSLLYSTKHTMLPVPLQDLKTTSMGGGWGVVVEVEY